MVYKKIKIITILQNETETKSAIKVQINLSGYRDFILGEYVYHHVLIKAFAAIKKPIYKMPSLLKWLVSYSYQFNQIEFNHSISS